MAVYGTAPRKINGVWFTASGRRLSAAGQLYWDQQVSKGRFDTRGHRVQRTMATQASPKAIKPLPVGFDIGQPGHGKPSAAQQRQQAVYKKSQQATKEARATEEQLQVAKGYNQPAFARASKTVNPVVGGVLTAVSPLTAAQQTVKAVQKHQPVQAGVAALGILPIFPFGRGVRLGKAVEEGVQAGRAAGAASKTAKAVSAAQSIAAKETRVARLEAVLAKAAPRNNPELTQRLDEALQQARGELGAEQVFHSTEAAKKVYAQQEALRTVERGKRAGSIRPAYEEAGGGVAGHYAGLSELKGPLPGLRFDRLTSLDEPTLNRLMDVVHEHPALREFEKVNLRDALLRAQSGQVPRPFEVALVEKAFGPAKAKEFAALTAGQKIVRGIAEVANVPRSLMASFDVSAPFRQGLLAGAAQPKTFAKNLGPMFKMLVSEKRYAKTMDEIAARPSYQNMVDSGVKFTDLGDLSGREEYFMSNIAEKISGGKHGIVRASGRAYTGFLNRMRADMYDSMYGDMAQAAVDAGIPEAQLSRDIANFVNVATGRGGLGPLERAAVPLNSLFFAPRLLASRIQAFNPVFYANMNPVVRRKALEGTARLVAAGTTMLGAAAMMGAKVVTDPRNADWGKIKVGNTRFDIWGGHQQFARLIAQLTTGEIVSSTTGKTMKLSGGYGSLSRKDILQRFVDTKLAPTPSLVNDFFKGTDFADRPFSWKSAVVQRMIPLVIQDANDIHKETGSWPAAFGGYGIAAVGVGVQPYGPPKKKGGQSNPNYRKPKTTRRPRTLRQDPMLPSWASTNRQPARTGAADQTLPSWAR